MKPFEREVSEMLKGPEKNAMQSGPLLILKLAFRFRLDFSLADIFPRLLVSKREQI